MEMTCINYSFVLAEEKRKEDSYKALLHAFTHSLNNFEVFKLIFNFKDDNETIFTNYWVSIS